MDIDQVRAIAFFVYAIAAGVGIYLILKNGED